MTEADRTLIQEKHRQLDALLPGLAADCWLVLCREGSDPAALLVAGFAMVGEAAFVFTRDGQKHAVVADYDRAAVAAPGVFDSVTAYSATSLAEPLSELLARLQPQTIALDFSEDDPLCDGLSYGLWRKLKRIVGDDLESRITSAASILTPLRAQKSPEELRRLKQAVALTEQILDEVGAFMRIGMTEREVAEFIKDRQRHYRVTCSFGDGAAVMCGRVGLGHRLPTDARLEGGDTVVVDMGIYWEGYTSDIMRTYYLLREDESAPPAEVQRRFAVARDAVKLAAAAIAPGKRGFEIDAVARAHLEASGIPPYSHALGHQIGRTVHDGGALLAPLGRRYGERGNVPIAAGEVYTLEPVIHGRTEVDGVPIGPEKDIVVMPHGAEFLSPPQEVLVCIR